MNIVTPEEKLKFHKSMSRISGLIRDGMEKDPLLSNIGLEQIAFAMDVGKEFIYYDYPFHEENTEILNNALASSEQLSGKDFEIANKFYDRFLSGVHGYIYYSYEYNLRQKKFILFDSADNMALDKKTLNQFLPVIHCAVNSEINFDDMVVEKPGSTKGKRLLVLYKWPKNLHSESIPDFTNPRSNILICTFSLNSASTRLTDELINKLQEGPMDLLLEDVLMNQISKKFASELLTPALRAQTLSDFRSLSPMDRKVLFSLIEAKTDFGREIVQLHNGEFEVRDMVKGFGSIEELLESEIRVLIKDLLIKSNPKLELKGMFTDEELIKLLDEHEVNPVNRNKMDTNAVEFILDILYMKDDLKYDGSQPIYLHPSSIPLEGFSFRVKPGVEGRGIFLKKMIGRRIVLWYYRTYPTSIQALQMSNVFCLMLFGNTCTYEAHESNVGGAMKVDYNFKLKDKKSERSIHPSAVINTYLGLSYKVKPYLTYTDGIVKSKAQKVYDIIGLQNEEDILRNEEVAFWNNIGQHIPKVKRFLDAFELPAKFIKLRGSDGKIKHDGPFVCLEDFRILLHAAKRTYPGQYQALLGAISSVMESIDQNLPAVFQSLEISLH